MLKEFIKRILEETLKEELSQKEAGPRQSISERFVGKICMFRTESAGVHFGELVEKDHQECLVKNSRRVFYWTHACSLSQLAMEGSKDIKNCKIAMAVDQEILDEVIEIIPMSDEAIKNLSGAADWKK